MSTMSMKYLGETFDFHGGGSDLIFPHHENEIAQSEGCTGIHPFVHYWLHNGFITVNEEKMSKSLGNFFMVIDILEHYDPETLVSSSFPRIIAARWTSVMHVLPKHKRALHVCVRHRKLWVS